MANERTLEHPQGKVGDLFRIVWIVLISLQPIDYTLLLSQIDKTKDVYYTLSVFSTVLPFACVPCPPVPTNQVQHFPYGIIRV